MSVRTNAVKSINALIALEGSKIVFVRKVGVSRAAVTNWTSGLNAPDIETIAQTASLYSVPLSDILEGNLDKPSFANESTQANDRRWVDVPLYGSIAAGIPIEMEAVEDTFVIPHALHARYPKAFLLRVVGESMNRKLPNGSYALINPCKRVVDGRAYAVCVNGYDATIKRVGSSRTASSCPPTQPTSRSGQWCMTTAWKEPTRSR